MSGIRGRYVEDSIYDIDPSAAEAFDREFPAKGKVVGTESQRRFDGNKELTKGQKAVENLEDVMAFGIHMILEIDAISSTSCNR